MVLANVATMLARWGKRVLIVDWDLEAPGIENFFFSSGELDAIQARKGLVELLAGLSNGRISGRPAEAWKSSLTEVQLVDHAPLSLLTAGARSKGYFKSVRQLDVKAFYEEKQGGQIVEQLRSAWKGSFDFVFVDSRIGVTDIGGICTIQLPDILAIVFTATDQSLCGAVDVAEKAAVERQKLPFDRALVPVLPIPNKFDTQTERERPQKWLDRFERIASSLYDSWLPKGVNRREFLEATKLPYSSYYSFGEELPVIQQGTVDPAGLGFAYETLAALIGNSLENGDLVLSGREELVRLARAPHRMARIPLRQVAGSTFLFVDLVGARTLRGSASEAIDAVEMEKNLNRYEAAIANVAASGEAEIALSQADCVLFAFLRVDIAIRSAIALHKSLAVADPISGPRGPLRTRSAIHLLESQESSGTRMEALLKICAGMAGVAKDGQIVISKAAHEKAEHLSDSIEFRLLTDELELPSDSLAIESLQLYEIVPLVKLSLTAKERTELFRQPPESKSAGGFQAFLVALQKRAKGATNELVLDLQDLERIARYAHDYRGGGWQGRLRKIFGRTLGPHLGRETGGNAALL